MMGMGEPLLNLGERSESDAHAGGSEGVGMRSGGLLVDVPGIIPRIGELGKAEIRPKLAISLNASTEEMRQELMPITRKWHLKDLIHACRAYPLRAWEKLTFEYVLLEGS